VIFLIKMKQRKQMDVYIYMVTDQAVKFFLDFLIEYAEKKTTRLTGVFIDYCEKTHMIETRPSLQNLLKYKKTR